MQIPSPAASLRIIFFCIGISSLAHQLGARYNTRIASADVEMMWILSHPMLFPPSASYIQNKDCIWMSAFLSLISTAEIYIFCMNHRIIESQGGKRPIRSPDPTIFSLPLLPQATKPYLAAPHPDAS